MPCGPEVTAEADEIQIDLPPVPSAASGGVAIDDGTGFVSIGKEVLIQQEQRPEETLQADRQVYGICCDDGPLSDVLWSCDPWSPQDSLERLHLSLLPLCRINRAVRVKGLLAFYQPSLADSQIRSRSFGIVSQDSCAPYVVGPRDGIDGFTCSICDAARASAVLECDASNPPSLACAGCMALGGPPTLLRFHAAENNGDASVCYAECPPVVAVTPVGQGLVGVPREVHTKSAASEQLKAVTDSDRVYAIVYAFPCVQPRFTRDWHECQLLCRHDEGAIHREFCTFDEAKGWAVEQLQLRHRLARQAFAGASSDEAVDEDDGSEWSESDWWP